MARSIVERVTSDLSGAEIAAGEAWVMELQPPDGRRNKVRLDISAKEAAEFARKGAEVKRRGRPPGSTSKSVTAKSGSTRQRAKKVATNGRRRRRKSTSK
jgi:hypothetical protein